MLMSMFEIQNSAHITISCLIITEYILTVLCKNPKSVFNFSTFKIKEEKKTVCSYSVGNPSDQCTEFVTIFNSSSGRIFSEYLDLYLMECVQIKCRVGRKSSSFWWCKCYSAIWPDSREHSENIFLSKFMYIVLVAQIDSKNIL